MVLTDDAFLAQFEECSLAPEHFDHRGHLRLAWLYLQRYPLEQAVAKVTQGIEGYASSLGAAEKFQHTLTEAIVRIMEQRLACGSAATLEQYLTANVDLVEDIRGVLANYYSAALLSSPAARCAYVAPDLRPL